MASSLNTGIDEDTLPECIICACELSENAVALTCGHIFHEHCVQKWFGFPDSKRKCPICKERAADKRGIIKLYFKIRTLTCVDKDSRKEIEKCGSREDLVNLIRSLQRKADHQASLIKEQQTNIKKMSEEIKIYESEGKQFQQNLYDKERESAEKDQAIESLKVQLNSKIKSLRKCLEQINQYKARGEAEEYWKQPQKFNFESLIEEGDSGKLVKVINMQHLAACVHRSEYEKLARQERELKMTVNELNQKVNFYLEKIEILKQRKGIPQSPSKGNSNFESCRQSIPLNLDSTQHESGLGSCAFSANLRGRDSVNVLAPKHRKKVLKRAHSWKQGQGLLGSNHAKSNVSCGKGKYTVSGYDEFGRFKEFRLPP